MEPRGAMPDNKWPFCQAVSALPGRICLASNSMDTPLLEASPPWPPSSTSSWGATGCLLLYGDGAAVHTTTTHTLLRPDGGSTLGGATVRTGVGTGEDGS